jgi:hypothetical protein
MIAAIQGGAALAAWAAAVYKARELRVDPKNRALRAFCAALATVAAALTIAAAHSVDTGIDRLVHVPNIALWIVNSLTLVSVFNVQMFLLRFTYPPATVKTKAQPRRIVLLGAVITMLVLLSLASTQETASMAVTYSSRPAIVGYLLVYLTCLGAAFIDLLRLSLRYAKHTARRWVRAGLRLFAAGSVTALGYVAHKAVFVLCRAVTAPTLGDERTISAVLGAATVLLICVGTTIPAWGPWLDPSTRTDYHSYRQLQPLWTALSDTFPEIAFAPSGTGKKPAPQAIHEALYRQVIEIRDGMLLLRDYLDPDIEETSRKAALRAGMIGDALQATVEAAKLTAALEARRQGRRAHPGLVAAPTATPSPGADLSGDVAWLKQVARAFSHSPIVREAASPMTSSRHE